MIGALTGAAAGAVQLVILYRFVGSVTSGRLSGGAVICGVLQLIVPMAALLACALFLPGDILPCAVALTVVLCGGAVIIFMKRLLHKKDSDDK